MYIKIIKNEMEKSNDNGNLKFEGDYEPNGKGKEYYDNGLVIFEGHI